MEVKEAPGRRPEGVPALRKLPTPIYRITKGCAVADFTQLEGRVSEEQLSEEEASILRFLLCRTRAQESFEEEKELPKVLPCQSDDLGRRPIEEDRKGLDVLSSAAQQPSHSGEERKPEPQECELDGDSDIELDDLDIDEASEDDSEEESEEEALNHRSAGRHP